MSTIVTRNVDDLPAPSRKHLEELLGQQLRAHQRVFIIVDVLFPGPSATAQARSASGIRRVLAQASGQGKIPTVSDDEADAAVNEAMSTVRRRP